jgi:hypothetical protein
LTFCLVHIVTSSGNSRFSTGIGDDFDLCCLL